MDPVLMWYVTLQINSTKHDWHMRATIEGEGFSGPAKLLAKAGQTTNYPLVFKPTYEAEITVSRLLCL